MVIHQHVIGKTSVLFIIPALENNFRLLFPRAQHPRGASQGLLWSWFSALAFEVCFYGKRTLCNLHVSFLKGRRKQNPRGRGDPL